MCRSMILKKLISLVTERAAYFELLVLTGFLEKDCSFSSAFPFPSALFCVSFPILSDVFRIDSLL
jgi:hypothetical protein